MNAPLHLALRVGLFPFVKVDTANRIVCRCVASTRAIAHETLRPGPDEAVVSLASHGIGSPKSLAEGLCAGCGLRPRWHLKTPYCHVCAASIRRDRHERSRALNEGPGSRAAARRVIAVRDTTPLPPAVLAECRAELDRAMSLAAVQKGKHGRPVKYAAS